MSFGERSRDMGLTNLGDGNFHYADRNCEVMYTYLSHNEVEASVMYFPAARIPNLAIHTRRDDSGDWRYTGCIVSDLYKFEGNEAINNGVRGSIAQIGTPILREETLMSDDFTRMHNIIIIQNPTNIPAVGDIYPQISVGNSYNGKWSKSITFGINIKEENRNINFGFQTSLGSLRQIHHQHHGSNIVSPIGTMIDKFAGDITALFESNIHNRLSEEDIMNTLDLVEKAGKRRRNIVSTYIDELTADSPISSWQMFLAIAKFSSTERNLNAKRLLEDVAERVLILPVEMLGMVVKDVSI